MFQRGRNQSSVEYIAALSQLQRHARGIVEWSTSGYDLLLTPALAERPVPIGEIDTCSDDPMADFARSGLFTPFTAVWNVTGQPAIALPLYQGEDGMPAAVQVVGPPAGEAALLTLAAQLEAELPWAERRPEI
jgi:amidase